MKLSHIISNALIYLGVYYILYTVWREMEIKLYGFTQESIVDTIVGFIVATIITGGLSIWRAWEDNK